MKKTFTVFMKNLFPAFLIMLAFGFASCNDEDAWKSADSAELAKPLKFAPGFTDSISYPLTKGLTPTDWMSKLDDNTKVCNVSIPGTHDTMTGMGFYNQLLQYVFNITAISQVANLTQQLESGLRFFDIRSVAAKDSVTNENVLLCAHGISEIGVTLDSLVSKMIVPFLEKHPGEFVIMKIQHDNGYEDQMPWLGLMNRLFKYYAVIYPDLFYEWKEDMNPTVADVRGKIVLMCRCEYELEHMKCAYVNWGNESADNLESEYKKETGKDMPGYIDYDKELKADMALSPDDFEAVGTGHLYVQDYYVTTTAERLETKKKAVCNMLDIARNTQDIWTINHTSAYTVLGPTGYCRNAQVVNKAAIEHILTAPHARYGIVVMDFGCYDKLSCIINGGDPYFSDYLYNMNPLSQSLTNLVIMSNFE